MLIDWFGGVAVFGILGTVITFFLQLVSGGDWTLDDLHIGLAWVMFGLFMFAWFWIGTATTGKTIGKLVLGIRAVADDGTPLSARRAIVRVLVLPISIIVPAGLIGVVVGRRFRALHDVAAHSAVVYDWGERRAQKPKMLLVR